MNLIVRVSVVLMNKNEDKIIHLAVQMKRIQIENLMVGLSELKKGNEYNCVLGKYRNELKEMENSIYIDSEVVEGETHE